MFAATCRIAHHTAIGLLAGCLLSASLLVASPPANASCPAASKPPDDGAGTYLVSTIEHLLWIRDGNDNGTDDQLSYDYRLVGDIEFNSCQWTRSIADGSVDFTGTFDGDGHEIAGISIESAETFAGLFGDANGASFTDLALSGFVRTRNPGTLAYAGLLAGRLQGGSVSGISISGAVVAVQGSFFSTYAGGIAGWSSASIDNSYSSATVTSNQTGSGSAYAGGIAGQGSQGIQRVYATGSVSGKGDGVSGIAARPFNTGIDGHGFCLESASAQCVGNFGLQSNTSRLAASVLKTASTYTDEGWDLTDGFGIGTAWSICSNINDGFPFLSVEYSASPCVPGLATGLSGSGGDSDATITWTAAPNNGDPITGYKVEYSSDGGGSWQIAAPDTGTTATTATVSGLLNGTPYEFRVSAINGNGTGEPSTPSAAITPRATGGGGGSSGSGGETPPTPSTDPAPVTQAQLTNVNPERPLLTGTGGPLVLPAGSAVGYLNTSELPPPTITTDDRLWTVAGDGYALQVLGPQAANRQPRAQDANAVPTVVGSQTVSVAARGFAPGTLVRGWVMTPTSDVSGPPAVTWEADSTGSAVGTIAMAARQSGPQTLQFRGVSSSGPTLSILFGVEAVTPQAVRFAIRFQSGNASLTKNSQKRVARVVDQLGTSRVDVVVTQRVLASGGSVDRELLKQRREELRKSFVSLGVPPTAIRVRTQAVKKDRVAKRSIVDILTV